jgi:hypothetical protein
LISNDFISKEFCRKSGAAIVENSLIPVKLFGLPVVGRPPHPFRLRRQIPFVWIEFANQPGLDPRYSRVSPVRGVVELGLIGDLPPPGLAAAKSRRAIWLPKHRHGTVSDWAHEVPLPTTEVSRSVKKDYPLVEASKLNTKPTLVLSAHVRGYKADGNFAPIRMRPFDSTSANVRAVSDKSLSGQPVQIQFQSILQANPFAWPGHPRLHAKHSK